MEEGTAFREEELKMRFEEFSKEVEYEFSRHKGALRRGQTLMNVLLKIWPEKYHEITASDEDCFYDDSIVPATMKMLEQEWGHSKEPEMCPNCVTPWKCNGPHLIARKEKD